MRRLNTVNANLYVRLWQEDGDPCGWKIARRSGKGLSKRGVRNGTAILQRARTCRLAMVARIRIDRLRFKGHRIGLRPAYHERGMVDSPRILIPVFAKGCC